MMPMGQERRSQPGLAKPADSSWLASTYTSLRDTLTNRHHSRDFVFAHAFYMRSRVMAMGIIFLVMSPVWLLVDQWVLPSSLLQTTLVGRLLMMAGFAVVVWWAWRSEDNIRRIRFSAGALLALPALFYMLVLTLVPDNHSAALVGYSFIPFLLVAVLSVFPFTLVESLLAGLLLQSLLVFVQHIDGSWMTPTGLEAQWLMFTLLAVTLTANHFQLSLLLRLYRQATHDALTGLLNRGALEVRLAEIERAESSSGTPVPYAVLMMDIDHFKRVNDVYGHSVGDKVLREFARLIALQVRSGDFVARYGGEEFVVILLGASVEDSARIAERIRDTIENATLFDHDGNQVPITTSIGVACPHSPQPSEITLKQADDRLYKAKENGRNRVVSTD
ncbi:GGDEF domain-containing protein [Halomonas sp. TBZ9]|uniref:diguanylate cyclase n=1 Tax=Vreelandella azerica TaxID=2732867 RepID=A0A7Y3TWD4_9GAMM|nr:GGDEF domain-containing protein [Halomonas azerica]NOG31269.1 GGDEF domain-containing protein [Halomonas azerica]